MGKYKIITNKHRTFFISSKTKIGAYFKALKKLEPKEEVMFNIPYDTKAMLENL